MLIEPAATAGRPTYTLIYDPLNDALILLEFESAVHRRAPDAKIEYHPVVLLNVQTGSIGWMVIDGKTAKQVSIFRRALSGQLLALFD